MDDTKMREIRHRMGRVEDAIDAVHGSLAYSPELDEQWRDEFCTDLVVIRTKLEAIACALSESPRPEPVRDAGC
jgi:hypothetical protein